MRSVCKIASWAFPCVILLNYSLQKKVVYLHSRFKIIEQKQKSQIEPWQRKFLTALVIMPK